VQPTYLWIRFTFVLHCISDIFIAQRRTRLRLASDLWTMGLNAIRRMPHTFSVRFCRSNVKSLKATQPTVTYSSSAVQVRGRHSRRVLSSINVYYCCRSLLDSFYVARCQDDDGYIDGRHTGEHTQVHSARLPLRPPIQVLTEVDVAQLQWTCHWASLGRHRKPVADDNNWSIVSCSSVRRC